MPRKRMIDPNFWRDEKIAKCSFMERLLFQGLWTYAEDSGVGRANPLLIKADVFPYDTLREADIEKSLAKLAGLGLIQLYENDGQKYYYVINFKKHQVINRPSPSDLPLPLTEHSLSTHGVLTAKDNIKEKEYKVKEEALPSAEASDNTASPNNIVSLILNDKTEYEVTGDNVKLWAELYPAVDVMQELRNMKGWCIANSKQRKTRSGIDAFINRWLSKQQNNGKKAVQVNEAADFDKKESEGLQQWQL